MTSAGQVQAQDIATLRQGMSKRRSGICVSVDWPSGTARVNVEGANVDMPMAGPPPTPQRACWVGYLGNQPVCLGPVWRAPLGVVQSAPANGLVSVKTDDGGTYTVAYDAGLTLTATQRVWIDWTYGGVVLAVLSADPITHDDLIPDPPVVPPPAPGGAGFDVTRVFNPVTSGTQNTGQSRLWTSQVYCGDTTVGGFFYGDQVGSTIPDTAPIKSVRLFVNQESGRGNQPTIGLHSLADPGGVIAVDQAVAIPAGTGWKTLPNAFGDALKTGYRKGLGTNHGGFWIWAAANQGNSGALEIVYGSS